MIKEGSFVTICSFMVTDLKLKGSELIVYAAIYGFSQDGDSWFSGTRAYLAEWAGCTKTTVSACLKSLVSKGLIERRDKVVNGVALCDYRATFFEGVYKKFGGGCTKNLEGGVQKICPHNIKRDYNLDNKDKGTGGAVSSEPSESVDSIIEGYTSNPQLLSDLKDFAEMRKRIRKPLTVRGVKILLKGKGGLDSIASNDDEKIAVVQKSIASSWLGFFPLKKDELPRNRQNTQGGEGMDRIQAMAMQEMEIMRQKMRERREKEDHGARVH